MVSLDLGSLVSQIVEIVANPSKAPAKTGDAATDHALADLRVACAAKSSDVDVRPQGWR